MKIFRALIAQRILSVWGGAIVFLSGCATAPKSAPTSRPEPRPATTSMTPPAGTTSAKESPSSSPPAVSPATTPSVEAVTPPAAPVVGHATIKGSEEDSILLDNFTAFVAAVDGKKIAAGRSGWDTPLKIDPGHRVLTVEFNRGVFFARAKLELQAAANASYELKYTTDAELFGHNSFCNFWIVDQSTGKAITPVRKASVEKLAEVPGRPALP